MRFIVNIKPDIYTFNKYISNCHKHGKSAFIRAVCVITCPLSVLAVLIYGSGSRAQSYLATRTSKRRFTRLRGKINSDLYFKSLPRRGRWAGARFCAGSEGVLHCAAHVFSATQCPRRKPRKMRKMVRPRAKQNPRSTLLQSRRKNTAEPAPSERGPLRANTKNR